MQNISARRWSMNIACRHYLIRSDIERSNFSRTSRQIKMTDTVRQSYISQLSIRTHLVTGILIFLDIPIDTFRKEESCQVHRRASFRAHLLSGVTREIATSDVCSILPHYHVCWKINSCLVTSLVDCVPPRAKYRLENYGIHVESLLQYSKEDVDTLRPVALSGETSEIFSSELVDCD